MKIPLTISGKTVVTDTYNWEYGHMFSGLVPSIDFNTATFNNYKVGLWVVTLDNFVDGPKPSNVIPWFMLFPGEFVQKFAKLDPKTQKLVIYGVKLNPSYSFYLFKKNNNYHTTFAFTDIIPDGITSPATSIFKYIKKHQFRLAAEEHQGKPTKSYEFWGVGAETNEAIEQSQTRRAGLICKENLDGKKMVVLNALTSKPLPLP